MMQIFVARTAVDGQSLHAHLARLFPIMRSVTGPGVRETLDHLSTITPIQRQSVSSGTPVLDWTVPPEWHFRQAWIERPDGSRAVDAANNTLHVVNFSVGVDGTMTRAELEPHLHSLPEQPDRIPYRTSYYADTWGFCLSEEQRRTLGEGPFRVVIDAERRAGVLDWGEIVVPGESTEEILVSTHICHPGLANDNGSGMVLAAALADWRTRHRPRHTWRFVFVPGTIGAISWLASRAKDSARVAGGLVITGLGDERPFTYKETPAGDAWIDRVVRHVLAANHPDNHGTIPFGPYGYDERQYCSPGFRLPVGRLTRGVHGTFPEYHTSGDDLSFVTPEGLVAGLDLLQTIAKTIDRDVTYRNLRPHGEPQLGRRGLYGAIGAQSDPGAAQMAMLWLLNASDGRSSLLDIATRSGIAFDTLCDTAALLVQHDLLTEHGPTDEMLP